MKNKKEYKINPKMSDFLEIVFTDLKNKGEVILNKKYLLKIYNKCINKK